MSKNFPGRRLILALVILLLAGAAAFYVFGRAAPDASMPLAKDRGSIVDIRGRSISVRTPVHRIAIDDSRFLVALSLIDRDPVASLAAWPADINRLGPETYRQWLEKSPALAKLPKIASSAQPFDIEAVLAAKPDVVLLSQESNVTDAQVAQLSSAGIPVIFIDFFAKPLSNLEKSLAILGKLTGRSAQAEEFLAFRREHMTRISDRINAVDRAKWPSVFVEAHAGMNPDCCNSPGSGNVGDYLAFVGAHNIGADVIKAPFGKLNLEYVISRDPAVYIATGGPHLAKAGGLVLGPGFTPEVARASLHKMVSRTGISGLTAVKTGNVHGFSHQLINSPLDIIAIETFARWVHPELFSDISPEDTLREVNRRFLAVPYDGTYWIDIKSHQVASSAVRG